MILEVAQPLAKEILHTIDELKMSNFRPFFSLNDFGVLQGAASY